MAGNGSFGTTTGDIRRKTGRGGGGRDMVAARKSEDKETEAIERLCVRNLLP